MRNSVGSWVAASVIPSQAPELVNSSTSQACAIFCIQVPVNDTVWPMMYSRKLRV